MATAEFQYSFENDRGFGGKLPFFREEPRCAFLDFAFGQSNARIGKTRERLTWFPVLWLAFAGARPTHCGAWRRGRRPR